MKFSVLSQPVGLLKLVLNLCVCVCARAHTHNIQERKLCWCDFMKYMFNIVMCQDTCEPICFKLWMILDTTKLYSLISSWITLMFTQGHRFTGKLELVHSFCCKVAWSNSDVHDGWLCMGGNCEDLLLVWQIWISWAFALHVLLFSNNLFE